MINDEGEFTLRETADELAQLDGKDADQLYQQLRGLYQRGLFKETSRSGAGRTAATLYDAEVLWRLRLLLPLVDLLGTDSDHLKRFDDLIRAESLIQVKKLARIDDNWTVPIVDEVKTGLKAAIDGIRRGEDWILAVTLLQDTETGGNTIFAVLCPAHAVKDPTTAEFKRDYMQTPPYELRGFLKIPATDLLRPLLIASDE